MPASPYNPQAASLLGGAVSFDGIISRAPNVQQRGSQASAKTQLATATTFIQTQGTGGAPNGANAHGVVKAGSRYYAFFTGRDSATHPGMVLWYTDDLGVTWTKHSQIDSATGDYRPCIAVDDETSPTHLFMCWGGGNAVDLPLKFAHITTNLTSGTPGAATVTTIDAGGAGLGVYQPCMFVTNTGTNPRVWIVAEKQTAATPTYEYRLWYVGLTSTDTAGNWTSINNLAAVSSGTLANKCQTGTAWKVGGVDKAVIGLVTTVSPDAWSFYIFDPTATTPSLGSAVASGQAALAASATQDWVAGQACCMLNGSVNDYLLFYRADIAAGTITVYKSIAGTTWTANGSLTGIPANRANIASDGVDYYLMFPNGNSTPAVWREAYVNTSDDSVVIGDFADISNASYFALPRKFTGTAPVVFRGPAVSPNTMMRSGQITSANRVTSTPIGDTDSGAGTDTSTPVAVYTSGDAGTSTFEGATVVISLSNTDQDSAPVETASLTAQETGTDSDATPVEQAQLRLSGADANSTTTESGGLTTQEVGTDANSSAETGTPTVNYSVSDLSGATGEAIVLHAAESGVDSGQAATELAALLVAMSSLDSGGGTGETGSLLYLIVAPDSGSSATQTGALVAVATATDNGSDVETIVLVAISSTSDSGSDSESGSTAAITLVTGTDSNGATAELASFFAVLTGTQAGSDLESAAQVVQVLVSDANLNVVEASVLVASALLSDSAVVSEIATLLAARVATDAASDVEIGRLGISTGDTGSTFETASPSQTLVAAESAIGADLASLVATALANDSGTSAESAAATLLSLLAAIKTGSLRSSGADGRLGQAQGGSIDQSQSGRIS